ncbi:arginyl-tRNA synthetase-like protein [Lentithecium fluviatile CBS 122367]|uniref:arginine--tRNA ligase n=1 Tax=Lentithecium fluviatile CBS 122367 TaxID=1168545 RepID=A0A6G1IG80_9PLEO|nr:arginyl-tRNA synthetase-like protein [Lentithecium fluviatile CBS 122367]
MATPPSLEEEFSRLKLEQAHFPNCYPEYNPLDAYKIHISERVGKIAGVEPAVVYPALQRARVPEQGDLNLAVPALRIKGTKPQETGAKIVEQWTESPFVQKLELDGVHLKIFFNPAVLTQAVLPAILKNRETWGGNPQLGLRNVEDPSQGKKKIVVEFSSPNIAKPFHAGHLRSTIIGSFLANLHEISGWDVTRLNYLGDWGKQYGLLALGFGMYGDEAKLEADPIQHLFEVYVKINQDVKAEDEKIKALETEGKETEAAELQAKSLNEKARQYFKAMCDDNKEAVALWSRFRKLSIEKYKNSYARLNVRFDEYDGESQVSNKSMKEVEARMAEKGLLEESKGATIVNFEERGKALKKLGKVLIRKQDGTSLYITRDLGAMFSRVKKYNFDKMIYVVANQQDLHLKQLFTIVDLLGEKELYSKVLHVNFGMVRGMSTRKGNVVFLDDILRDVRDHMHEVMRKNQDKYAQVSDPDRTADILGISSVMIQDMGGKRIHGYDFDMDKMTSFEGDTGPYLQYSHARLRQVLRKADLPPEAYESSADLSLLTEPLDHSLVRLLVQYPDIVQMTLTTLEPTTILTYLFLLTHGINSHYHKIKIIGSEPELMKARLALYDATKAVLNHGMRVLGLQPLERM